MEGLRHQGRPRRQWIHDIEEWTGCEYIQIKEMSQDRAQWRRKISEWSSAVAKPHRGRSTSEWVIIKNNNYYRAMLCIVRTMLSQDVRPSVCPSVRRLSVTRRYSVEATKCIITLFFHSRVDVRPSVCPSGRVATSFYFFRTKRYGNIPTGTHPPNGGVKKIAIFNISPIYRFISEMIQDRAIVTIECE